MIHFILRKMSLANNNKSKIIDCIINGVLYENRYKIPIEYIDEEIISILVNNRPEDILKLPLDDMDYNISQRACKEALFRISNECSYWVVFRDIPLSHKDFDMCAHAYERDCALALYMPEQFITYEMVLKLSKSKFSEGYKYWPNLLDWVPMKFRNSEICYNYVKLRGYDIKFVPDRVINIDICETAFETDPNCFCFIPDRFKSNDMCGKALELAKSFKMGLPSHYNKSYDVRDYLPKDFI